MYLHQRDDDNLDPRRRPRNVRRRDWASRSALIGVPNLPQLLTRVLVRLGLVR